MNYWLRCFNIMHNYGCISYASFFLIQLKCLTLVIISSFTTICFPYIVSRLIDDSIGQENTTAIIQYAVILGITGLIMIGSEYAYRMSYYKFSQHISVSLKELIFKRLLHTNIRFWNNHAVGDIFKILEDDVYRIQDMFARLISVIVSNLFLFIAVAGYLLYLNTFIGLILILTTLTIFFLQYKLGEKLEQIAFTLREKMGVFSTFTNEALNNIINIEMIGAAQSVKQKYSMGYRHIIKESISQVRAITLLREIMSSYNVIGLFIVIVLGSREVIKGSMSIGTMVSLTMYVQWLLGPMLSLGSAYTEFKSTLPIIQRIIDILDTQDVVDSGQYSLEHDLTGKIVMSDVCFSYQESSETAILNKFNLIVHPGQKVGIVGENGSGKSTLFRLLFKVVEPDSGNIIIDNISLKDYSQEDLVSQIGCFLQDVFVFSGSLRQVVDENHLHTDQEILEMMESLNLDLKHFPQGLDTHISENNLNISGGEAQKIALTRLLLQDYSIYLLDEPTAAMDAASAKKVCQTLKRLLKKKTAVIITHSKEVQSICDKVIPIVKGGIL